MNVKAQGLHNGAKYIEETFGRDALGEVLRACGAGVRESYTTCLATSWHPAVELCEFVDVAQTRLGGPRRSLAQEIGSAGARANMKGVLLRVALYWGKPEFLIKRIAGTWQQYNDEGTMEVVEFGHGSALLEVKGSQSRMRRSAEFSRDGGSKSRLGSAAGSSPRPTPNAAPPAERDAPGSYAAGSTSSASESGAEAKTLRAAASLCEPRRR